MKEADGNMVSWEKVMEDLVECIDLEAGIRLDAKDFKVEERDDQFAIAFRDFALCIITPDQDQDEADLAQIILEKVGDIKDKLVEIKIEELRPALPKMVEAIRIGLSREGLTDERIGALDFDIKDLGHWPDMHGMTDAEVESGYPEICLVITDDDDLQVAIPLNIYYPDDPLDVEEAISRLMEEL